jgi:hypothetical protein
MEEKMTKYSVVTTFHKRGYEIYGKKMIETFLKSWPKEVTLYVYGEDVAISEKADNLVVLDLHQVSSDLVNFKNQWRGVPKANGDVRSDPIRSRRRDAGKGFKWDAVRFSHKVYSIFHCAKICNSDVLIWMDADTICHSSITISDIQRMIPADKELCYLGRKGKFSECGLYSMNLQSEMIRNFLQEFQRVYDQAEAGIFLLDEWHDSFVFDSVRERFPYLSQLNWSETLGDLRPGIGNSAGEGHPLINSEWGAWLDHLKGDRKHIGRSKREDLKVVRTEPYWQQFN